VGAAMGAAAGHSLLDLVTRWFRQDRGRLRHNGG
jgi:hypothetical protein